MEKRAHKRFKTRSVQRAKVIDIDEFTIKDISIGGICLETSPALNISNIYRIEIVSGDDKKITPKGVVVRSFLKGTQKTKDETVPVYEAGIKFIELDDSEINFLKKFIREIADSL